MFQSSCCGCKTTGCFCPCKQGKCDIKGYQYVAILTGKQENPPNKSTAHGIVYAKLKDDRLVVKGCFKDLSCKFDECQGANVHLAIAGMNGPAVYRLDVCLNRCLTGGTICQTLVLSDGEIQSLKDKKLYINIHSEAYPNGEIRGQILAKADKYFISNLKGSKEVPPVITNGFGTILYELKDKQLVATGSFNSLSSPVTAAHIHSGHAGINGPVIFNFTVDPINNMLGGIINYQTNAFTLTKEQRKLLKKNELYANIHTDLYPDGEIRGQLYELID